MVRFGEVNESTGGPNPRYSTSWNSWPMCPFLCISEALPYSWKNLQNVAFRPPLTTKTTLDTVVTINVLKHASTQVFLLKRFGGSLLHTGKPSQAAPATFSAPPPVHTLGARYRPLVFVLAVFSAVPHLHLWNPKHPSRLQRNVTPVSKGN